MFLTEWLRDRRIKKLTKEITGLKDQLFELKKERLRIKNSNFREIEKDSKMDKNRSKTFNIEVKIKILESKLKGGSDK